MLRVGRVIDDAGRQAAFELRYRIFVEERGRFKAHADHAARILVDAHDATACLFSATIDGQTVATVRYYHGTTHSIPVECGADLELHRIAEPPFNELALINWLAIAPEYRGSLVPIELLRSMSAELKRSGAKLLVMHAVDEPAITSFYRMLGFRRYLPYTVPAWDGRPIVPMVKPLSE